MTGEVTYEVRELLERLERKIDASGERLADIEKAQALAAAALEQTQAEARKIAASQRFWVGTVISVVIGAFALILHYTH